MILNISLRVMGRRMSIVIYCEMLIYTTMRLTVPFNPGRQLIVYVPIIGGITVFLTTIKRVNDV